MKYIREFIDEIMKNQVFGSEIKNIEYAEIIISRLHEICLIKGS